MTNARTNPPRDASDKLGVGGGVTQISLDVDACFIDAVLISASGTMVLSSSTRLGRMVDRVRSLSDRLQDVSSGDPTAEFFEGRRAMPFDQHARLLIPGVTLTTAYCFTARPSISSSHQ